MKDNWKYIPFVQSIKKIPKQPNVKSKDYLPVGMYPIVSQESDLISGYSNDVSLLYQHDKPVVVFGDHTKNVKYVDFDFVTGADGTHILLPIEELDSKFYYYFLRSIKLRDLGYARHLKLLKEIDVPIPPISEQQRIARYLDESFAKIDALKVNAEKSLADAKALFQAELKKAMEPKEGWEEKKLGEVADIKGGKRVPKGYKLQSEPTLHKYIRVADFNDCGSVDLSDIQYISDDVFEQIKRYTISTEDLYISIAGTIGKSGIIPEELEGANLTENACKLVLDKNLDKRFVYYFTQSNLFKKQIDILTKKSAQPKLALTRLAIVELAYPSLSEQQSIVTHLDTLSAKVTQLQQNLEKIKTECDALKQALLKQVFE